MCFRQWLSEAKNGSDVLVQCCSAFPENHSLLAAPSPTTEVGNRYILATMFYFSKWVGVFALPNQEHTTVTEDLLKVMVSRFGVPLELHCEQGRVTSVFGIVPNLEIRKTRTTPPPPQPQSDGMKERIYRTNRKYLSKWLLSTNKIGTSTQFPVGLLQSHSWDHWTDAC